MDTTSVWKKISSTSNYPQLLKDIEVDVAIIGGGITGITTALQLINAGKKVSIIEAHKVGGITTSSSTGNLYIAVQPFYQNIIAKFNLEIATIIAQSRAFAIDFIERNTNTYKINCNFHRRPWYLYTNDNDKITFLEKELEAFIKMGFPLHEVKTLPLNLKFKKAAVMENQARFNPLQYVSSLAQELYSNGCLIFEHTHVINIHEKEACILDTSTGHRVLAKQVVMATHTPIGVNTTQLFTAPYRSYVVSIPLQMEEVCEGHFWSLDKKIPIISTQAYTSEKPNLLMVSGSHHKVGQEKDAISHFAELETFLHKNFADRDVAYQWSAQHYQTADDIPYIGLASRHSKHTYMATGFFADGLVYGTISGILVSDLILSQENPWNKAYTSQRFALEVSAGFLAKENFNYLAQYYYDFPHEPTKLADLKPGEARVIEIDREKWGVYKDENKELHIVSAVCTHMKCIVHWNTAEKTWDCPCHGSRFTPQGEVIEGPAQLNLKKKEK